ncbi:MAG: DoxX family membrane protein [Acidobacteriota bacterium]|nr:DoxX family membrane protein [Acidobacteriota bacterium]
MRKYLRWTAAGFYAFAGVLHFVKTSSYLKIMPSYVPWPQAMVYLSGAAEIAGGIGLLVRRFRRWAAFGLIALMVAVFPANIYMATNHVQVTSAPLPDWVLWARLPVQLLLVWWLLYVSCAIPTNSDHSVNSW